MKMRKFWWIINLIFSSFFSNQIFSQNMDLNTCSWDQALESPLECERLFLKGLKEARKLDSQVVKFKNVKLLGILNGEKGNMDIGRKSDLAQNEKRQITINLPEEVCFLTNLQSIRIYGFLLQGLPNNFQRLVSLEDFRLELSSKRNLQEELSKLSKLPNLKSLTILGNFSEEEYQYIVSMLPNIKEIKTH